MQLEAAIEGVLQEELLLEISQNSQENTCSRVSFFLQSYCKKDSDSRVFL